MEAHLDGPVPDLRGVPGVSAIEVDDATLRCHVTGPIEPLLAVLTPVGVRRLVSREPSLEELFLAHYGSGAGAGDGQT